MNMRGRVRLIAVILTGLLAGSVFAQTSNENEINSSPQPYGAQSAVTASDSVQPLSGGATEQQYAPALDGSGLISMDSTWKTHMLLGATVGGGWDSSPDNQGTGVSSGVYTLSPYFGIKANTPKTQYLLQYQPTISRYSSSSYPGQTMHVASVVVLGNISERWKWNFEAKGSHGQDSIRLLAPQQTVAVGEVPGTGPNSASYLQNAGIVTYVDGGVKVSYSKSERDSFEFGVANSFSNSASLKGSNSIATGNVTYNRGLSPTLAVIAYVQPAAYYGSIHCLSVGGGIGFRWHVRDQTVLSLSGGPQLDAPECGKQQGFSYSAAFSTRLSGKSQIYLLSARQPTTSYLGPGLWQTSASGGYQRQVATKGTVSFDLGYVGSDALTTVSSFRGMYADGIYSYAIGHGLSASLSYRGYIGDWSGIHSTRNTAQFSLVWTPVALIPLSGHVFQ